MKPDEIIHPLVFQSLQRYLSYGWGNAIIQDLIRFRFNVKMNSRCLKTLRENGDCTPHCQSVCPFKNIIM